METLKLAGSNFCTTIGGLTATGTETVYDTAAAIIYSVDGKAYSKAAVTDGATPTTDINTGSTFNALQPDKGCAFTWMLDAAGAVAVAQGPIVDIDGDTDVFADGRPQFPAVPVDHTPFAYQLLQTSGASSAWTFGSGNWDATGVTDVIVDVLVMPSRPQDDTRS